MNLHIDVTDPEVIQYLSRGDAVPRATLALRIGVLALSNAEGQMDAETIRNEGARIIEGVTSLLKAHAAEMGNITGAELARYLHPQTGAFQQGIERLVAREGLVVRDLESALAAHVGESGTVAKTLMRFIGDGSPLLRMLDPGQENGLRGRIEKMLQDAVQAQRNAVLAEFSLDKPDSALSRLLRELGDNNSKLTEELSLDKEDSALARLVTRVEAAAAKSTSELTLDNEGSALNRLRATLIESIASLARSQEGFQERVLETLARFDERERTKATGTQHGFAFEFDMCMRLEVMADGANDLFDATGSTTGVVRNCKVGDAVITVGPEKFGSGKKIVFEAKEDQSYNDTKALAEIELGAKNREAEVGVFVFSSKTAPAGTPPFRRFGNFVLVVWDREDRGSDVYLTAAYALATALITRAAREKDEVEFDFTKIDTEIAEIEKQIVRVVAIREKCESIRRAATAIEDETRIASDKLTSSLAKTKQQVDALRSVVGA